MSFTWRALRWKYVLGGRGREAGSGGWCVPTVPLRATSFGAADEEVHSPPPAGAVVDRLNAT